MKKFLLLTALMCGCASPTMSVYEAKKATLEKEITILKLELRKIRLEKQISEEEKEY